MTTPSILITFDYELYFGERSGTFEDCLERPTAAILDTLDDCGIKVTFFVDVLYYWRLVSLERHEEAARLKARIQGLLEQGHDVQLHIHPHWVHTTVREDGGWHFPYESFRLHGLPHSSDPDPPIDTLEGCIIRTQSLLEAMCREVKPDHTVFAFRAGGWCLQPFADLRSAFLRAGVRVDSSVNPGGKIEDAVQGYDYSHAPRKGSWRFDTHELEADPNGPFLELPITTVHPRNITALTFRALRKLGRGNWRRFGQGTPMRSPEAQQATRAKKLRILLLPFGHSTVKYMNFDTMTRRELNWVMRTYLKRTGGEGPIVSLSHPKAMSPSALREMAAFVREHRERSRFETFAQYAGETVRLAAAVEAKPAPTIEVVKQKTSAEAEAFH